MKFRLPVALAISALALLGPAVAAAHFVLVSPTPTLKQNALGDPQKLGPCGGTTPNPGEPSGVINEAVGGDSIHIKVQETIFHPGHYRVSLAVLDRAELPDDPITMTRDTPKGPYSVSAPIDPKPKAPVLADGLFVHTEKQPAGSFQEADVRLPNINCDKCTVQIIEWMGEHPLNKDGGYTYHHCAEYKITANPKLPIDIAWPGQAKTKAKPKR
jgi:hypothetical protein